jgi:hypothetical protein
VALQYVTLTGTLGPGAVGAVAEFTPSGWLTDASDALMLPPAPQAVTLLDNGTFSVVLLATDNTAPVPPGWSWSAEITGIPGVAPYAFTFSLKYATGATQDISALVPL